MRVLVKEKLSQHKYKDNSGYLICVDSILARTGPQEYLMNEIYPESDSNEIITIDRKPEQVFSTETLSSFENKPLTCEHPSENVGPENHKEYAVGFVRDVKKGFADGKEVMLGTLVIQDPQCIEDIENNIRTDLSCGYDCDITEGDHPEQINIRGNHVALCEQGRAGIAKIVDSIKFNPNLIKKLIGEEEDAIKSYEEAISQAKLKSDYESKKLFEHILEEEMEHLDELKGLQDMNPAVINDSKRNPGRYPKVTQVESKSNGEEVVYTIGDKVKLNYDPLTEWEVIDVEKAKDVGTVSRDGYVNKGRSAKALIKPLNDKSKQNIWVELHGLTHINDSSDRHSYEIVNVRGHYEVYRDNVFVGSEDTYSEASAYVNELMEEDDTSEKVEDAAQIKYVIYLDTDNKYKGTTFENYKSSHKNMDEITNLSVIEGLNTTSDMIDYVIENYGYAENEIGIKNRTYLDNEDEDKSIKDFDVMGINKDNLIGVGSIVKLKNSDMNMFSKVYEVKGVNESGEKITLTASPILSDKEITLNLEDVTPLNKNELERLDAIVKNLTTIKDEYSEKYFKEKLKMLRKRKKDLTSIEDKKGNEAFNYSKNKLLQTIQNQIDECCKKLNCDEDGKPLEVHDSIEMSNEDVLQKVKSLYKEALLAYGKDGYASWKEIEKYLHTADDCEKVAKILKQDIDKKRKEGTL